MDYTKLRPFIGASLLLALAACAGHDAKTVTQAGNDASAWRNDVTAMASATSNEDRRLVIRQRLADAGLQPVDEDFKSKAGPGVNQLVIVSGDKEMPLLLLGAHFDKVEVGQGVTDNAAGSAVVMSLARRFKQKPLNHHRVVVAFWDQEEKGLLGASAHVAAKTTEKPALYVNFDVFGWGDTLWMMTPDPKHALVVSADAAARAHGIALSSGDKYPPTDHLAFLKAGWPAVSFSLVGGDEIPTILQAFSGAKPVRMPKVMAVIHSERDTLDEIDAVAVATGIDAVEAALRDWDARKPH